MKCPSVHKWSDTPCIREAGHEGYCYGKATRNRRDGTITRAHWTSKNGVFKSHHWYETKYPTNAARGGEQG
jgi:hypothetical protein